jgi:hypothetical protein
MLTGSSVPAWQDQVFATAMPRAVRWFALAVIAPRTGADGIVRTGGAAQLAAHWRRIGPRGMCSGRLVRRMLAVLARAGLLEVAEYSAPGRPAAYRIRLPAPREWAIVRRRGISSSRIHRTFMAEQRDTHVLVPP